MTFFEVPDAKGFISYAGIGLDQHGSSPNDWIADLDLQSLGFDGFLECIRVDATKRLQGLPSYFKDRRQYFAVGAFVLDPYRGLTPVTALISNYQSMWDEVEAPNARPELSVEMMAPKFPREVISPFGVLMTGATGGIRAKQRDQFRTMIRGNRPAGDVRKFAVKTIKDQSYKDSRRATIGTSTLSGILFPDGQTACYNHVVGGSSIVEPPNFLTPGIKMKDFYMGGSEAKDFFDRYNPNTGRAHPREIPCGKCRNPVPEGYKRCPVCDEAQ